MPPDHPPAAPPNWPTDARGRLVATMAQVASERGYAATRVRDVLVRTGISSRTFYTYFDNRAACFFAAYAEIVDDLEGLLAGSRAANLRAGRPPRAVEDPDALLTLTLGRLLEHFAAWPAHARVLLVEVQAAGPPGAERHEQTMAMLAEELAACPRWQPGRCDSLERHEVAQAVIGAIVRMVQLRLAQQTDPGPGRSLPALLPSLTALTTRVGLAA
jgi:AcrR family transcriptional regulator